MDLNKLSTPDKVIGASAILFLIALFMPWYGFDVEGVGSYSEQGWDYFLTGIIPFILAAVMAAQIAISNFTTTSLPKPPIPWSQIHLIAGVLAAVLVVLRLLITADRFDIDLDRKYGLWIAVIAALALAVGGFLKNQESEEALASPAPPPAPS